MGINPNSANNAGILMDRYIGTKFDIVREVAEALPWLSSIKEDVQQAAADLALGTSYMTRNEEIYSNITATYGSMQEIADTADYVQQKQTEIETSLLDMAYNLIRTQAIVAKYHSFQ